MHLNYYFIKRLSAELAELLIDYELVECYSQNKDELILSFLKDKEEFHIRALLTPQFTNLSFPKEFSRARKNSIDLFPEVVDKKVARVRQFVNERSFSIDFDDDLSLLFKMHGKRSNIILYKGSDLVSLFNNQMKFDLSLQIEQLDRPILQNSSYYQANGLEKTFPTFDKKVKAHLSLKGWVQGEGWEIIEEVLLEMSQKILITQQEEGSAPQLTLLGSSSNKEQILFEGDSPLDASNQFYYLYTRIFFLKLEKDQALKNLNSRIKQVKNYLKKSYEKLDELEKNARYNEIADILMANLHQIPEGATTIELFDFYRENNLKIKLKKNLSPQKNAETYYRKAKNQKIETDKITSNILSKEQELEQLSQNVINIDQVDSLKDLRKLVKSQGKNDKVSEGKRTALNFNQVQLESWSVYIGRNAKNNDELTQKFTHKDDLWLHAKDVTGSHVVIKRIPGKEYPKYIIEKAAQLAAYYSKRKNDTLCPVIYTPKKYVRKPKGLAPGQVIVDREEVILVEPCPLDQIHQ